MKQAILYKKLPPKAPRLPAGRPACRTGRDQPLAEENNLVKCEICSHNCIIAPGKRGLCGVRENKNGKLFSLVYGKAIAINLDPIEKKPFFHFLPGTYSLSIATMGCNFSCLHCQNYDISQGPKENGQISGENLSSTDIVRLALKYKVPSISYTYTEPSVFIEYALETMKLAKKQGIKNTWVTNGYLTEKALKTIAPYLHAANVDLKFFDNDIYKKVCNAQLQPILDTLKLIKKLNIWLEVTTLIIPGYTNINNQLEKIAEFIKNELGSETPWHVSRFYPCYKMNDISPTSPELIHQAVKIGQKAGLKYVYAGNLPNDKGENTYCPKCQTLIIQRTGYDIKKFCKQGKCPECGEKIDLILD